MSKALVATQPTIEAAHGLDPLIALVTDTLTSHHSRRAYRKALTDFIHWWIEQGRPAFSRALVNRYKTVLQDQGLAPSTINQRLSAVRRLATEAAYTGLADQAILAGIKAVRGVRSGGIRTGKWLTLEQAQVLINTPNTATLKGLRDRAILAVLIGAGLRREETARLDVSHLQILDDRPVLADIVGKRNKIRTVPLPDFAYQALTEWLEAASIREGRVFRPINRGGHVAGEEITAQALYGVVGSYTRACGLSLTPHDLRRTFSKLARQGGARLEQIQLALGHASIQTTERYLGTAQDLTDGPGDHIALDLT